MKFKKSPQIHLLLVALIVLSIASVVAISVFSCSYAHQLAEKASSSTTVDVLLSAGIGIMGIMVAVWTALTISNAISRKDVDNLIQNIEIAKENMASIDAYIEKDVHTQAEHFYVETSQNNWDPLLRYIIQGFTHIDGKAESTIPYADLTIIELKYTQVRNWHKNIHGYGRKLVTVADEGLKIIDEIEKESGNFLPEYVINYLNYRKCSFNFFSGYFEEKNTAGIDRFIKAAYGYEKLADAFQIDFENDSQRITPDEAERKCHLANSIGESYSKTIQLYCNEFRNEDEAEAVSQVCFRRIDNYIKLAINYCEIATSEAAQLDEHSLSVFFRNFGVAYERANRFRALMNQEPMCTPQFIAELYEKSIYYAMVESPSDSTIISRAYFALLAYLGNYLFEARDNNIENDEREYLLKKLCKFGKNALDYFPWSQEFVVLCELIGLLCNRYNLSFTPPFDLKELEETRLNMISESCIGKRVSRICEIIDKLRNEDSAS